jgi:hypothetical protein
MSSSLHALRQMLEKDGPSFSDGSPDGFYRACVEELMRMERFECLEWDDNSTGSTFFTYLLFPRDERSIRLDAVSLRGDGLLLYLCTQHPVACYGAMNVFAGSHSAGSGFLDCSDLQTLPLSDWVDVEGELLKVLEQHGIAVLTRKDALVPLHSLGLQPPAASNMTAHPGELFYAFFNNDY